MKIQSLKPGSIQDIQDYQICTDLFSVQVDPLNRTTYQAQMEVATLGSLSLAKISTGGAIISRQNEEFINPDFKRYSFVIILDGEMILSYHHGDAELRAGQFLFIDNTYPRSMLIQNHVSLLVISLPGIVLKRYFPETDKLEGKILNTRTDQRQENAAPYAFVLNNWEKILAGCLREFAPTLSNNLLQQLAACYLTDFSRNQSKGAGRIRNAKDLIEKNLHCPGFKVEDIAGELKVSSRYLRSLFSSSEKISHYLMRRRLEICAQRLVAKEFADKIITEIAFGCGFCNIAHFSRSFKKHYKVTPREYRKLHVQERQNH